MQFFFFLIGMIIFRVDYEQCKLIQLKEEDVITALSQLLDWVLIEQEGPRRGNKTHTFEGWVDVTSSFL